MTEHNPQAHPGITGWHHGLARWLTRKGAARPSARAKCPGRDALADALIAALDDPPATSARAEAARVFAREACAWDVVGPQMLAAYEGMRVG